MVAETFGAKIIRLRTARCVTQNRLALQAGITRQCLSQIEKDRHQPQWRTVQMLAVALDVSMDELRDSGVEPVHVAAAKRGRGRPAKEKQP